MPVSLGPRAEVCHLTTMTSIDRDQLQEINTHHDSPNTIDENEVKEIIESIKEAQYFDASSMAPLTPAALVSTFMYDGCKG